MATLNIELSSKDFESKLNNVMKNAESRVQQVEAAAKKARNEVIALLQKSAINLPVNVVIKSYRESVTDIKKQISRYHIQHGAFKLDAQLNIQSLASEMNRHQVAIKSYQDRTNRGKMNIQTSLKSFMMFQDLQKIQAEIKAHGPLYVNVVLRPVNAVGGAFASGVGNFVMPDIGTSPMSDAEILNKRVKDLSALHSTVKQATTKYIKELTKGRDGEVLGYALNSSIAYNNDMFKKIDDAKKDVINARKAYRAYMDEFDALKQQGKSFTPNEVADDK